METQKTATKSEMMPFYKGASTKGRRVVFFGSVLLVNMIAVLWLADLFWRCGIHRAHVPLIIIFAILNGLLVLGSFHALFGALDIFRGKQRAVCITELAACGGDAGLQRG